MQTPIVETIKKDGKSIDVVDHINKDAYNYVLDAKTGKPVIEVVETPVPQDPADHTYPTQPIPKGDELVPHVVPDPENYKGILAPDGKPYIVSTTIFPTYTDQQYVVLSPSILGGVEWPQASWDPKTGTEVACTNITTVAYKSPPAADQHPVVRGNVIQLSYIFPPSAQSTSRLVAFNPATNKIVWKHDDDTTGGIAAGKPGFCSSQVTTTASGLALIGRTVVTDQYPNGVGMIQAYSMTNGAFLWQVPVLVNGTAAPVIPRITTYSVGGKQYIVSFTHFGTLGPDLSAYTLP